MKYNCIKRKYFKWPALNCGTKWREIDNVGLACVTVRPYFTMYVVCVAFVRGRTLSGVTCPSTSLTSQIRSTRKTARSLSQLSFQSQTHRVSSQYCVIN